MTKPKVDIERWLEDETLNISASDVAWDRKFIAQYKEDIKNFQAKRDSSKGRRRGAYQGQITRKEKAIRAMQENLDCHLKWLKRYKPEVYEEVK